MNRQRGFTLIELLVVIAIIAALMALLFPAIGAAKRIARRAENGTNIRSVIQAMITASESKRGFFPGFEGGFEFTPDGLTTTGNSGPGQYVQARYWILLDGGYLDGDALISPSEGKDTWLTGVVTTQNYSFAMLKIASDTSLLPGGVNSRDSSRREEWRNEQNAQAPIVSDRLAMGSSTTVPAASDPDSYASIHDDSSLGRWVGSVGFGDVSVKFFKEPGIATRIADFNNVKDDIFAQRDTGIGGVDLDKNAAMAYENYDIIVAPAQ
jgi:prepilin-type N-terminal cleavage/methylation domain-containing protein